MGAVFNDRKSKLLRDRCHCVHVGDVAAHVREQ